MKALRSTPHQPVGKQGFVQDLEVHLTEAQIDDYIIGDMSEEAASHLAVCPACANRIYAQSSALSSFQAVSTTWSERLSAVLPTPMAAPSRSAWQRYRSLAAPCMVLIFGLTAITVNYHAESPRATKLNQTVKDAVDAHQSGVTADNQMLSAIDAELSPDNDSASDLGLWPAQKDVAESAPTSVRD